VVRVGGGGEGVVVRVVVREVACNSGNTHAASVGSYALRLVCVARWSPKSRSQHSCRVAPATSAIFLSLDTLVWITSKKAQSK